MDNIKAFKEQTVNNYVAAMDTDNIDVEQIKRDLHRLIGETPAVQLNYIQDTLLNEDGTKSKKLEKLKSISVVFTYEIQVGDKTIPIPVKETYEID